MKTCWHHRTMGHLLVVTESRYDRPKLKRRGFVQLKMSKDPDEHWFETAMQLAPGSYTVKSHEGANGEAQEIIYEVKDLGFRPFDYTVGQWDYLTSVSNAKPSRRSR